MHERRRRCCRCSRGSARPRRRSAGSTHNGAPPQPPLLSWLGAPTPPLRLEHTHHRAPPPPLLLLWLDLPMPPLRWKRTHDGVPLLPPLLSWLGAPNAAAPVGARASRGAAAATAALVARRAHVALRWDHTHDGAPPLPPLLLWLSANSPPLRWSMCITGRSCCRRCSCDLARPHCRSAGSTRMTGRRCCRCCSRGSAADAAPVEARKGP